MALKDLWIRIKGDNTGAKKAINETEKEVGGLAGKVKGMGAAFMAAGAMAAGAFAIIINWAKDTDFGLKAINSTMAVSKQLLTDLITGQKFNLKETIDIADRKSKIVQDDIAEGYKVKKMQSEIAILIRDAADQTKSHAEKLELLTKAMEKEKELKAFLLADAREELQVARDYWEKNKQSIEAKKAYYAIATKIADIEGMDSRRLQSQFTGELKAQADRARDLAEAFEEVAQTIEEVKKAWGDGIIAQTSNLKIGAVGSKAGNQLAGGPQQIAGAGMVASAMGDQAEIDAANTQMMIASEKFQEDWQGAWENTIGAVVNTLEEGFIGAFTALGEGGGLGDLANNLLGSMGNIIADLGKMLITLALTWIGALDLIKKPSLPTAIAALALGATAMAIGGMMIGTSKRKGQAMESGGGGASSGGGYSAQAQSWDNMKIQLEGVLKGSDIYISGQRYVKELSTNT